MLRNETVNRFLEDYFKDHDTQTTTIRILMKTFLTQQGISELSSKEVSSFRKLMVEFIQSPEDKDEKGKKRSPKKRKKADPSLDEEVARPSIVLRSGITLSSRKRMKREATGRNTDSKSFDSDTEQVISPKKKKTAPRSGAAIGDAEDEGENESRIDQDALRSPRRYGNKRVMKETPLRSRKKNDQEAEMDREFSDSHNESLVQKKSVKRTSKLKNKLKAATTDSEDENTARSRQRGKREDKKNLGGMEKSSKRSPSKKLKGAQLDSDYSDSVASGNSNRTSVDSDNESWREDKSVKKTASRSKQARKKKSEDESTDSENESLIPTTRTGLRRDSPNESLKRSPRKNYQEDGSDSDVYDSSKQPESDSENESLKHSGVAKRKTTPKKKAKALSSDSEEEYPARRAQVRVRRHEETLSEIKDFLKRSPRKNYEEAQSDSDSSEISVARSATNESGSDGESIRAKKSSVQDSQNSKLRSSPIKNPKVNSGGDKGPAKKRFPEKNKTISMSTSSPKKKAAVVLSDSEDVTSAAEHSDDESFRPDKMVKKKSKTDSTDSEGERQEKKHSDVKKKSGKDKVDSDDSGDDSKSEEAYRRKNVLTTKSVNARQNKRLEDGDSTIERYKRYVRTAGLRVRYVDLLKDCKSRNAKVNKLMELLKDAGLKGRPTLDGCRQLKRKLEKKNELRELDRSNILETEGRTRSSRKRNVGQNSPSISQTPPTKRAFSRLKAIVDSDASD